MEKRITFSAEDKGVASYMERMKRVAEEMGRGMIADARAYTTSGKEVIKTLEDQIRLTERRNKAEQQLQRVNLENRYASGTIDKKEYGRGVTDIRRASEEERTQVSLLRELIETVKATAKDELRSERKNVEEQIKTSKTVNELNPKGDELHHLKESVQAAELARVKKDEIEQNFWSKATQGKVAGGINMFAGAAGAPNMFQAGSHMIAPMTSLVTSNLIAQSIAGGVGGLLSKGFESAKAYEGGLTGLSQISGRAYKDFAVNGLSVNDILKHSGGDLSTLDKNIIRARANGMSVAGDAGYEYGEEANVKFNADYKKSSWDNSEAEKRQAKLDSNIKRSLLMKTMYDEAERMGYKRDEILGIASQTARSGGRLDLDRSLEVARVGRATGVDMNQLQGLNKTLRRDVSGGGIESITQDLVKGLQGRGAMNDTSTLPEYMGLLTQLGQQQVNLLGKVDMGINTKVISAFAGLSTDFKAQPEVLGGIIKSMQGGLGESGNKQIRALQYGVLSRIAPGKSMFQYKKMMEQASVGEGEHYQEYQLGMKELAGKLGGGNEDRTSQYTAALFGGMSLTNAEKVAKAKLVFNGAKGEGIDMTKMSGEGHGTGTIQKSEAQFTNWFEQHGEEVTQFVNTMVEGFGKLVGYSKEVNANISTSLGKISANDEAVKKWKKEMGIN